MNVYIAVLIGFVIGTLASSVIAFKVIGGSVGETFDSGYYLGRKHQKEVDDSGITSREKP